MKTIDRKDLKTNELSQQLDNITEYAKTNALRIGIWVGGAIVLAVVVFAILNNRSTHVAEAWAKLGASEKTEPADQIKEAREVAEAEINSGLTTQAWLRVGVISLMQIGPSAPAATTKLDWAKTAEEAFNKVLSVAPNDVTARGQALMSLGILAENKGDAEAAKFYKQIIDDHRFDGTPFKASAEFRLNGVDGWLKPVTIAPAPPPPPATTQTNALDSALPGVIPVDSPPKTTPGATSPAAATPPAAKDDLTPAPAASPPAESAPPATTQPAGTP